MKNGFTVQKICILVGICLLVGAVVMLAFWRWNISYSAKQAQHYVSTLQALIRFLFYGFPRRSGEEGEERYKRISRKTRRAAGSLVFLWRGERYVLFRDYVLHTSGGRELPAERVSVTKEDGSTVDLGGKAPGELAPRH